MTRHGRKALVMLALFAGSVAPVSAEDTAKIARGREVYQELRCRTCHSIAGAGNRRYPLDDVGARLTAAQIRTWIVAPREMDPNVRKRAYDKVPTDKLDALVAYMLSLAPTAPPQ